MNSRRDHKLEVEPRQFEVEFAMLLRELLPDAVETGSEIFTNSLFPTLKN